MTRKIVKEFVSFFFLVLLVLVFRSVFFEPFRIPSGSMIPTLMIGDFILVNKFAYGFKVPFSDWFTDPVYITGPDKPDRGDVIVFKYPEDPSINYIKRVIGLPGDELEIRDKVVYINGTPISPKKIEGKEIMADMDDKFTHVRFSFYKAKVGDHEHVYQVNDDSYFNNDYAKIKIPKDKYFVMGDNRDFSADSRFWKFVPFENIKGRAILVWFSLITGLGDDDFKFRPWRVGTIIN